jgi:hypothetical protein
MTFHINDAPPDWEKKLLYYEQKYQPKTHMDFLPTWQTLDMFAQALGKAGKDDPIKVAYALEGMEYEGPGGRSWMRKEDHQLIAPIYIASFAKAGTAILGASADPVKAQDKFKQKFDLPFTLLADVDHAVAEAYGSWVEKQNYGKTYWGTARRTFLVDPDGRIARVWPKVKPEGHAAEVLAVLDELQAAHAS